MSVKEPKPVPLFISKSSVTTEANRTGVWRFLRPRYDEKTAPCGVACPAGEDIARIQMLATQGLFKEAWETALIENPFPGVCGRICHHPCETVCNRGRFDEAVAIHTIERYLADMASRYELKPHMERLSAKKQRIAVAGAGPSGLAAAWFLALLGYECDVYEAMSAPGGVLRWGVPSYRLPLGAFEEEIARIEDLGVRIHCGKRVGASFLEEAASSHDAVFVGCGLERRLGLQAPGEDLPGIDDGHDLLLKVAAGHAPALNGPVAVIGGGYAAIEAARCVARLGGKAVLIYGGRRGDMPASKESIAMAVEEGVDVRDRTAAVSIQPDGSEYLIAIRRDQRGGEDAGGMETVMVGRVFKVGGFEAAETWMVPPEAGDADKVLRLNNSVLVLTGGAPAVFGGDLASASGSVAHAVASGKEAAIALDLLFREGPGAVRSGLKRCMVGGGRSLSMEAFMNGPRARRSPAVVHYGDINTDYFVFSPRIVQPRLLKSERPRSFAEIDLKISANLAIREAERCFNCGVCNQCDNCRIFCPDLAVFRDDGPRGRHIDYDYCKGCGICVVECPRNAMTLEEERDADDDREDRK